MNTRGIAGKLAEAIVGTLLRNTLALIVVCLAAFLLGSPETEPLIVTRSSDAVLELRESFAGVEEGPAPATLVGSTVAVENYHVALGGAPWVRGGFLTTSDPSDATGGSYRIARLDADVPRVGATFAFTEHTMAGGLRSEEHTS